MNKTIPKQSVQEIKAYFQNLDASGMKTFKNIERYQSIGTFLNPTAWLNLILSAFFLWITLSFSKTDSLPIVSVVFSGLVILLSIMVLIRPSLNGIAIFSLVFLFSGIWNIFLFLGSAENRSQVGGFALGILQVFWAYSYWLVFRRYKNYSLEVPSAEDKKLYATWRLALRELFGRGVNDPDTIDLLIAGRKWKGFLLSDRTVLVPATTNRLFLAYATDVKIAPTRTGELKTNPFTGVLIHEKTPMLIRLDQFNFDRLLQWLAKNRSTSVEEVISDLETTKQRPQIVRLLAIVVLILGTMGFFYLLFIMVMALLEIITHR